MIMALFIYKDCYYEFSKIITNLGNFPVEFFD